MSLGKLKPFEIIWVPIKISTLLFVILLNKDLVSRILLTHSNLPARLISSEGAVEITPPDFKTINSTGAGDATAAYIAAHGVDDIILTMKNACAAGAIIAGTNDLPTLEKISEVSELVEVTPR